MKIYIPVFLLLTCTAAYAQEGFSPTLPWGTGSRSVQAGDIRNNNSGFSPTMPYVKLSEQPAQHDNPHQDHRNNPNCYRGYGYYNNYYYGPGSGYYYNNGYNGYSSGQPNSSQGIPGYDTPLPSTSPPGY
ncbi:MAG: hypothetical protein KF760_32850 [Candidatus Eremiobacteraeota bacterium]|nr:hypothetical protein [Candidatus Eremiobacteraeota bacterium]MCW5868536.1 hypothetical protein [Candidatus Eremiobacteraeota bacterium]